MENADLRAKKGGAIVPWLLVCGLVALGGLGYWYGHRPIADELQKKEVVLVKASGELSRAQTAVNTVKSDLDKAQDDLKQVKADLQQSAQQKDADAKLLEELKKQSGG